MKISTRFFPVLLLMLWQLPLLAATVSSSAAGRHHKSAAALHAAPTPYRWAQATPAVASGAAKALAPTLSVYPNPSRGLIMVSLASKQPFGDFKLRLSNIIGREVRSVALRPEAADGGMSLNLSDLPAGMYFYSLVQNDKVVSTKRLVLQN